ncbi:MAG: aldo/keto reductase, partial [Cytophagales bacterium]|nr:aldo/keto reductase [Armatimonadota bacterium]
MNRRPFGSSGIEIGEIGLGCWQFGGDWGAVSEDDALQTLRAA